MLNFAYLADGQIENFDTIVEGMTDKSTSNDYLNLVGNLKLAGTVHTQGLNVDASADINNLNTKFDANIGGSVNAAGLIFEKDLNNHINRDGALYRHGGQVYLTVDDNFYIRDSGTAGGKEGAILAHFDTRERRFNINSEDKNHIPLNVQSNHDTHIQLKTQNDDNNNVYLVNRTGNFRLHSHGVGDMFGVNKDGHHYVRHKGDNIMNIEGDGDNPYISLGKTGKWSNNKWYLQNRNAHNNNTSDFCIGRHDEGCKAVITKDGVLKIHGIEYIDAPIIVNSENNTNLSWHDARDKANNLGGRLPTISEVNKYIKDNGNKPLYDKDVWVPINKENDYVSIGNVDPLNRLGKSHVDLFGPPGWADKSDGPYKALLLVAKSKNIN